MDLGSLFMKFLPIVVRSVALVNDIKASGADKRKAAIEHAVKEGAQLVEDATSKDFVNEDALTELAGHTIDGIFLGKAAAKAAKRLREPDGTPAL